MKFTKILALLTMLAIPATAQLAQAEEPVRVGVYLPLTGQNAFGGQLELEGIRLAHSLQPEILGRPVELIVVDNKSDKVEAANAVVRLTERDEVHAILGSYASSLSLAGGEVAEEAGIPVIATSSTNPLVTLGKRYNFRACFIDPYQGAAAAAYAYKELGYDEAALLVDIASDYAVGLSSFFRRSFEALGGTIVSEQRYTSGDQDFTAQLTEIITHGPDVVFMPAYFAEGAIIMKQGRELGGEFVFMGADAMDHPDTITIAGDAAEGFIHTAFPYDPNMEDMSEAAQVFTDAWYEMYPDKDPNANAALGYNTYYMLMDAITRAGSTDPEAITDALAATENLETPLGVVSLDENHDAIMPVGMIQYNGGVRTYMGQISAE